MTPRDLRAGLAAGLLTALQSLLSWTCEHARTVAIDQAHEISTPRGLPASVGAPLHAGNPQWWQS